MGGETVEETVEVGANEVLLTGRVSGDATGARAAQRRPRGAVPGGGAEGVAGPRSPAGPRRASTRSTCRAGPRRCSARRCGAAPVTLVTVHGALRRRFWRSPGGPASRYEVEVTALERHRAADQGVRTLDNGRVTPDRPLPTTCSCPTAFAGVVCDLDGVVYRGQTAVPHAVEALERLRRRRARCRLRDQQRLEDATGGGCAAGGARPDPHRRRRRHQLAGRRGDGWLQLVPAGAEVLAVGGTGVAEALRAVGLTPLRSSRRRRAGRRRPDRGHT